MTTGADPMIEQQYRVVADRDKGDDPRLSDIREGDRVTAINVWLNGEPVSEQVVRIERPVPTTDALDDYDNTDPEQRWRVEGVPTREQIAEVYSDLMRQYAFQPVKDAYARHLLGLFKSRLEAIIDADEPTRLRTAHLRVDIAALILNSQYNGALTPDPDAFYEGRTEDEQSDALEIADAVLALLTQPEASAEVPPIPAGLCGDGGCVFLAGHEGTHSWGGE